jgi:hypothetical protein
MEYENCNSRGEFPLGFAVAVAVLVLLVYYYVFTMREGMDSGNNDDIMTALDVTMKEKGTIVDFKKTIGDPSFSPTKYIYLADLYRGGKLTKDAVAKVMSDSSI